jgi:hypothetical protein
MKTRKEILEAYRDRHDAAVKDCVLFERQTRREWWLARAAQNLISHIEMADFIKRAGQTRQRPVGSGWTDRAAYCKRVGRGLEPMFETLLTITGGRNREHYGF